jgi:uncharacterized protein YdiU (UPF0061 family)
MKVMYAMVYCYFDYDGNATKIISVFTERKEAESAVRAMTELLAERTTTARIFHQLMRAWEAQNPEPEDPHPGAGAETEESPIWREWREQYNKWVDAKIAEEKRFVFELRLSERPNPNLLHIDPGAQHFEVQELPILDVCDTIDAASAFLQKMGRY